MIEQIAFAIVSACVLLAALQVVTGRNLVHGILWLGCTLSLTAVLFVMLRAPFFAGIQILLYAGGVVTLLLFGVMLTRRHEGIWVENQQWRRLPGVAAAIALFAVLAGTVYGTEGLGRGAGGPPPSTEALGRSFLTDHLLAFEALSLLLLAVMIGAIVLSRRRDHGEESRVPSRREVT